MNVFDERKIVLIELCKNFVIKKGRSITRLELEFLTFLLDKELVSRGKRPLFSPWFRTPVGVSSTSLVLVLKELCREDKLRCEGEESTWIIKPVELGSYLHLLDKSTVEVLLNVVDEYGKLSLDELRNRVLSLPEVKSARPYQVILKYFTE